MLSFPVFHKLHDSDVFPAHNISSPEDNSDHARDNWINQAEVFHVLLFFFLQDEDQGFTIGQAFQGLQHPIESTGEDRQFNNFFPLCQLPVTSNFNLAIIFSLFSVFLLLGRFQGKQSRSFPELSEASKESTPVRQLSDTQHDVKSKLPVASSRFPAVETRDESGAFKNPYSFNQDYKSKYSQKFAAGSNGEWDGEFSSSRNFKCFQLFHTTILYFRLSEKSERTSRLTVKASVLDNRCQRQILSTPKDQHKDESKEE